MGWGLSATCLQGGMTHMRLALLILLFGASGAILQRRASTPPPFNVDTAGGSKPYNTSSLADVIYPTRYHSPPLGPLHDLASYVLDRHPTYAHPVHLTRLSERSRFSMRRGVDAMMDRLLSIRRLPDHVTD